MQLFLATGSPGNSESCGDLEALPQYSANFCVVSSRWQRQICQFRCQSPGGTDGRQQRDRTLSRSLIEGASHLGQNEIVASRVARLTKERSREGNWMMRSECRRS